MIDFDNSERKFDPTRYIRLSELAKSLPFSYEALRRYGKTGVLPVFRHGEKLYVRSDVASAIIDGVGGGCLKELIHSALDSTPTNLQTADVSP